MAIRLGDLVVHPDGRVVFRGRPLAMAPAEHRLLERLASEPMRVHTRRELLDAVSPTARNARTVDVTVAKLRRALDAAGAALVTVRRVGYRLDPERLSA